MEFSLPAFLLFIFLPADADFFGSAAFMSPGSITGAASLFLLTRDEMTPTLWKALFNPGENLHANRTKKQVVSFHRHFREASRASEHFQHGKVLPLWSGPVIARSGREKTRKTFTGSWLSRLMRLKASSRWGKCESVTPPHQERGGLRLLLAGIAPGCAHLG